MASSTKGGGSGRGSDDGGRRTGGTPPLGPGSGRGSSGGGSDRRHEHGREHGRDDDEGGDDGSVRCSFCGKDESQVERLIAGPGVFICSECIDLCGEILAQEDVRPPRHRETPVPVVAPAHLPSPARIKETLDQYVIGQEKAKKILSVAVYNHYKRVFRKDASGGRHDDVELSKSNILMLGPTGCGKTLLAQTLARLLDVPFAVTDATALTEAGYVGEDVENILLKLVQNANYDLERAKRGIIYIDEIDKIARKSDNPSITRDVSGEGVQQALLKIVEGTVANIPPQGGRKHPNQEFIPLDTTDILFICGGAFDGIEKIIQNRIGRKSIGFGAVVESRKELDVGEILSHLMPQDLLKYGLIPEFVGRVPVVATLDGLDQAALVRVLLEPKNALLRQYARLFEMDGVDLSFDDGAVQEIARQAVDRGTGARGLRSILEHVMMDLMFEIPSRDDVARCVISKECVLGLTGPTLFMKDAGAA